MDENEKIALEAKAKRDELEKAKREELLQDFPQVWDTSELSADFKVISFLAPTVSVVRKSDGAKGSMLFCHSPRFYFDFQKGSK